MAEDAVPSTQICTLNPGATGVCAEVESSVVVIVGMLSGAETGACG